MATIRTNNSPYLLLGDKVTTPSLIIHGAGYVPLFRGNINSTVDYNRWRYTLGALKVGDYRAAVSRTFINHNPSVTVGASSNRIANGSWVTITAYASDPDGDSLSYRWNTGATSRTITVSASNTTNYYNCTVSDPYGGRATSNTVGVTWYNPNRAPYVTITNYTPSPSFDGRVTITFWCSDSDNDRLYYQVKTGSNRNVVVKDGYIYNTVNGQTRSVTVQLQDTGGYNIRVQVWDTSNATDYADRYVSKDTGWNARYWVYDTRIQVSTGSTSSYDYYHYRKAEMFQWPARMNGKVFWCGVTTRGGEEEGNDGNGTVYGVYKVGEHQERYSYRTVVSSTYVQTSSSGGTYEYTYADVDKCVIVWDIAVDASKDVYFSHGVQVTGGFI